MTAQDTASLETMPEELHREIVSYISLCDIYRMCCVSKYLRRMYRGFIPTLNVTHRMKQPDGYVDWWLRRLGKYQAVEGSKVHDKAEEQALATLLQSLTKLREVTVRSSTACKALIRASAWTPWSGWSGNEVKELTMYCHKLRDVEQLADMITRGLFPNLTSLSIHGCRVFNVLQALAHKEDRVMKELTVITAIEDLVMLPRILSDGSVYASLTSLTVDSSPYHLLGLAWSMKSGWGGSLKRLSVCVNMQDDESYLREAAGTYIDAFCTQAAISLTGPMSFSLRLSLDMTAPPSLTAVAQAISRSRAKPRVWEELRQLTTAADEYFFPSLILAPVYEAIAQGHGCPHLVELNVRMEASLGTALSRGAFPQLQKLALLMEDNNEGAHAAVAEGLRCRPDVCQALKELRLRVNGDAIVAAVSDLVNALCEGSASHSLEVLEIHSRIYLYPSGGEAVVKALSNGLGRRLKKLDLSGITVGEQGRRALAALLMEGACPDLGFLAVPSLKHQHDEDSESYRLMRTNVFNAMIQAFHGGHSWGLRLHELRLGNLCQTRQDVVEVSHALNREGFPRLRVLELSPPRYTWPDDFLGTLQGGAFSQVERLLTDTFDGKHIQAALKGGVFERLQVVDWGPDRQGTSDRWTVPELDKRRRLRWGTSYKR